MRAVKVEEIQKIIRLLVIAALILSALSLAMAAYAQEEEEEGEQGQEAIVAIKDFKTFNELERFVRAILEERGELREPFMSQDQRRRRVSASEIVQVKPRPKSGFGRYDVNTLKLLGIYMDNDLLVAMFRAPDNKLFAAKVGEEAYDGKIDRISLEGGYVKFVRPRLDDPTKTEDIIVRLPR